MLTVSDLIHLPYPSGLTEAGIAYACRYLSCPNDPWGVLTLDYLRRMVGQVAVELAFRRYLGDQDIHFSIINEAPFTHPDRYNISLGGHRCIIKSTLITRRSQISQIRRDPRILLQAPARIPLDEYAAEECKSDDLYVFAFLLGLVAAPQRDVAKALAANQPVFLVHLLPEAWARPRIWIPLEKLALKSECDSPVTVGIGGLDAERNFITVSQELPPRQRVSVQQPFYSVTYIYAQNIPEARIGLHCPIHGEPYIIPAHAWSNLWVYGLEILLAGWLTHEEFQRSSTVLNAGMHTLPYDKNPTKNLQVPINHLNPLGKILDLVHLWQVN